MPSVEDFSRALFRGLPVQTRNLPQGYTYLAQMLAHELVPASDPACRSIKVSGRCDLDSVYGEPAGGHGRLLDEQGRFVLNARAPWDLPRDPDGEALLAERRNDLNLITAQLHLLWMRLHNHILDEYSGTARGQREDEVRRHVVLTFQLLVVDDLLARLLDERIYRAYFIEQREVLNCAHAELSRWFGSAAFRFGHSMVRPRYTLNQSPRGQVELAQVIRAGGGETHIPRWHAIDWRLFFPVHGAVDLANSIDTSIVMAMKRVPDCGHVGRAVNVGLKNLQASVQNCPPAGELFERVVEHLTVSAAELGLDEMQPPGAGIRHLTEDARSLPAWLYVLCEAEHAGGDHLGPLASTIVAEFVRRAIMKARWSVFHAGRFDRQATLASLGEYGEMLSAAAGSVSHGRLEMAQLLRHIPSLSYALQGEQDE